MRRAAKFLAPAALLLLWAAPLWAGAKEDFLAAQAAYQRQDYAPALELYAKALKSPETPPGPRARAYTMQGIIHLLASRWNQAHDCFAATLKVLPREPLAHVGMGRARYGAGDYQAAKAEFSQALEIKPDLALALVYRANVHDRLGEKDQAAADRRAAWPPRRTHPAPDQASAAASPDPDSLAETHNPDQAALLHLARARQLYRDQQDRPALEQTQQALDLHPTYPAALYLEGLIHMELGQPDQAVASFDRLLDLQPSLSLAYLRRGQAFYDLGQPERALADWDMAFRERFRPPPQSLHPRP